MSRQDKATTDRNARTLRELVKQPDNKNCADCRKNDARWASWNLGVFLCIRCSGIHRSMGTHISKVKSIDLDMWTPEQMDKWGNRRANLYWEKHLKAGHVPPDHKIESFIRSKYESKRWAMEGPIPSDPSVLEGGGGGSSHTATQEPPRPTPTSSAPAAAPGAVPRHPLLSRTQAPKPAPTPAAAPIFDLFADDDSPMPAPTAPPPVTTTAPPSYQPAQARPAGAGAAAPPAPTTGAAPPAATATATATASAPSNIFDLDFRAPTPSNKPQAAKADIMSLFATASPTTNSYSNTSHATSSFFDAPTSAASPPTMTSPYASWGGGITSSAPPVQHQYQPTQTALPTGNNNNNSTWGGLQMDQGAWGAPVSAPQPQAQAQSQSQYQSQPNAPAQGQSANSNIWGSSDPWSSSGGAGGGAGNNSSNGFGSAGMPGLGAPIAAKKDDRDPFANIWQ